MMLFKVLSRLLDYPDQELYDKLPELHAMISGEDSLPAETRLLLGHFMHWAQHRTLTQWQVNYVQTFDLTQDHSLHLTHHTFGDDRGRGPALIELDEHFKSYGYEVNERRELPDYLPLILEYVSTLDDTQARWFLGQMKRVLQLLAENLDKAESPYAALVRLVESLASVMPRDELARSA
jgi:nitrate reductase delta subunit